MKKLQCFISSILVILLTALPVAAFHVPPWDTGHNSFQGDNGDDDGDPGDNGCPPNTCCLKSRGASPVEVATGNFIYHLPVLSIPGYGPSIDLTLTYNSRDNRVGPFGHGWVHPYDERLIETTDGVEMFAVCTRANGKRERYKKNSDGTFTPPPHLYETLVKKTDGTFQLRDLSGLTRNFDANGHLTSFVDKYGSTQSFAYDAAGFMTRTTDAAGRSVDFVKSASGKVESVTDPAGRTFRFLYDAAGNLTKFVSPTGNATSYQYDAKGNLTLMQDAAGTNFIRLTYDAEGRVATHVDGAETWTYAYQPTLKRTTKRDSQGNTWTFEFNDAGSITKRTDPLGGSELYVYDANLNVTQFTNKNGIKVTSTYDSKGLPLTVTDALGGVSSMTYDPTINRPLTMRDPLGNVTRFEYNAKGEVAKITNALGNSTQFQYEDRGLLTRTTDPLGNSTTFAYDSFGNVVRTTDTLGNVTNTTFGILGQALTTTDQEGRVSQFVYDDELRLVRADNPLGGVTAYEYDVLDNLVAVTTPGGGKTTYQFDALNRLVKKTNPLGQSTTYTYDKRDNLLSKTDPRGQTITYTYNALDRPSSKARSGDNVSYSYDKLGNLLTVADSDSSLTFVYDVLSRLTEFRTGSTAGQPATVVRAAYDAAGNRKTMTDPSGGVTTYTYDALNQLSSFTNPANQTYAFEYDALSRRKKVTRPGGLSTTYAYDAGNRLTSLTHGGPPGALSFTYAYDRVGNRQGVTDAQGTHSYNYDSLYRLTAASHTMSLPLESYGYDSIENRTTSHLSSTYTYDAANRLTSDGAFDYAYDAAGNLTRKTERASGKAVNFTYDGENQLTRIDFPDGSFAAYRYDGLGRRIEKNAGGQLTRFVYDSQNILAEFSPSGTQTALYTQGSGIDDVLSVHRGAATYFYQSDALGSVARVVDDAGAVKASLVYDSFGQILSGTGDPQSAYAFQGREFDKESGLYYFRARYYDPRLGRFISEDPLGFEGGANFFAFVHNNPINSTDPLGLKGNPEYCRRLLETIQNIIDKIKERERELRDNPLDLPGSCAGDDKKPSLSRRGHQTLIDKDKANLSRRQAEYQAYCSDDPPNGSPAPNESYFDLKYWERVTGLTGAALIIFLLIWQGSRIIPARNLVPA